MCQRIDRMCQRTDRVRQRTDQVSSRADHVHSGTGRVFRELVTSRRAAVRCVRRRINGVCELIERLQSRYRSQRGAPGLRSATGEPQRAK